MYSANLNIKGALDDFRLEDTTFPFNSFVARLYNFCRSLGFEPGKILPSRAFCSDETQGYPGILIAKHFGAFPFNHGRVGGTVATDRHGPHAHHGKDLVIIHASHVGYNPENGSFGNYHRWHTEHFETTPTCGKIDSVLEWYVRQYAFAKDNIVLHRHEKDVLVTINNQILNEHKAEGLFLHLENFVAVGNHGESRPRKSYSTSKCYLASPELQALLGETAWPNQGEHTPIGERLLPELFGFKRHISGDPETHGLLEENLIQPMPWIVSSTFPLLTAAQANTQVEFDRTYRTLVNGEAYRGKRLIFISGLNVDISPHHNQVFPLTTFVPWAAFIQDQHGRSSVLEQQDIVDRLLEQSEDNSDEVDLEHAIQEMKAAKEIKITLMD
jgi:limiting CO2-inducible B/C-like protein